MLSERDLQRRRRRERERSLRRERELAARRAALRTGVVGFVLAAALPVVLWRDTVATIAEDFRPEWLYLVTGWAPWTLMSLGLLCCLPAFARMLQRRDRFYGASPAGWFGWGVTLYLLGFALATQVAQIASGPAAL